MFTNYTKILQENRPLVIPYMQFEGWILSIHGLQSPQGILYTPGSIQLLEWKSRFYDRGLRVKGSP